MSPSTRPRVVLVNRCFVVRDDDRFLLIKRAGGDRHYAGKWEIPGGKLDEGQDLSSSQEREVMEETGLLVKPIDPFVFADSRFIGDGPYKGLPYVALFAITRVIGGMLKLSDEHTEFAWVSNGEVLLYDLTPEVRKAAIVLGSRLK